MLSEFAVLLREGWTRAVEGEAGKEIATTAAMPSRHWARQQPISGFARPQHPTCRDQTASHSLWSRVLQRCNATMLSSLRFWLLQAIIAVAAASSDYHEQLLLRPLPRGSLLASFNFRSNESAAAFEQQNFRYFPRSFGQILQHTHAKELHLRFSVGRWDAENWGQRPWDGAREGGTGVELWAWIDADSEEEYVCDSLGGTSVLIIIGHSDAG